MYRKYSFISHCSFLEIHSVHLRTCTMYICSLLCMHSNSARSPTYNVLCMHYHYYRATYKFAYGHLNNDFPTPRKSNIVIASGPAVAQLHASLVSVSLIKRVITHSPPLTPSEHLQSTGGEASTRRANSVTDQT